MLDFFIKSLTTPPTIAIEVMLADKAASKIPGYTKVKNITNKIKDAGFSVEVGKDKIGLSYKKKF